MTGAALPEAPRRAVVVVSYGSHRLLDRFLRPLDLAGIGARVVVVDNFSSPAARTAITEMCDAAGWDLVAMPTNAGFGAGVNAGVARAAELGCSAYVLLNPDAEAGEHALSALFEHVEREPLTLVSPVVLRPDGSVWFAGATVDVRGGTTRATSGPLSGDPHGWLTGACLAVHAELWRAVGGFDPDYFLYWEDVDLSWRVRRAGGRLAVLSGVEVAHDVGGTQRAEGEAGRAKSPTYVFYNCRNRLLFAGRHLDRAARVRWVLTAPAYAWEVLQRGGRRALLHDARRLLWAAASGSASGVRELLRARPRPGEASGLADPHGRSGETGGARRTRHPRVRLYETVRTAHLERAHTLVPASIVYGHRRYDFDEAVASGLDLVQADLLGTARVLWRSPVRALEVNEPLMSSGLRRAAVAVAVARLRHPGARIVTYAIENNSPAPARGGARAALANVLERTLRTLVWRNVDRVAFGTEAARDLYARVLPRPGSRLRAALIPAVPEPCGCGPVAAKDANQVLFLGAFVPRKGFPLLLRAWPLVVAERPGARLLLVGKGELTDAARERAAVDPTVSVDIDPPRDRVHAHLRDAGVLVLPSQPAPGWREQVGLPLVEGLAHGATVVTTSETGLASWLGAHGHHVLDTPGTPEDLAAALVRALDERRPGASVLADLPGEDGRLAADRWLFADRAGAAASATAAAPTGSRR